MSAELLDAVVAHVRAAYTRQQVQTVEAYGGQFTAEETAQLTFNCPAIFVTVLGWTPTDESKRLGGRHVRQVSMAAFVVTKHAKRDARLRLASLLADSLALQLRAWVPDSTGQPVALAPLEEDPAAENMFGRAIDKRGMALWLVRWSQCVQPSLPLPELVDLLSVEITELVHQGTVSHALTSAGTLVVTDAVNLAPLPPA